jgi:hypothetical protein
MNDVVDRAIGGTAEQSLAFDPIGATHRVCQFAGKRLFPNLQSTYGCSTKPSSPVIAWLLPGPRGL